MAYIAVDDFRAGLDRRRPAIAGSPGSLIELTNAHLTRGGDIERRKRFVPLYDLTGTFGLVAQAQRLVTFGSEPRPGTLPDAVAYQRLQHPLNTFAAMTKLVDATTYDGKVYAVAAFDDGSRHHFYDGQYIAGWEAVASNTTARPLVALYLGSQIDVAKAYTATSANTTVTITAAEPGVAFTYEGSIETEAGDQLTALSGTLVTANVEEVPEELAEGSFQIEEGTEGNNAVDSVTVDGVELLHEPIKFRLDRLTTAEDLAKEINDNATTPNYTADTDGRTVVIRAAEDTGSAPNGFVVAAVTSGDVVIDDVKAMAGGVDYVAPVAQVVTFNVNAGGDDAYRFTLTLDDVPFAVHGGEPTLGNYVLTYNQKVYTNAGSLLRFSAVNTPTKWADDGEEPSGAGFINVAAQDSGSETVVGIGLYNGNLAAFSRGVVQVWHIDVDPGRNQKLHTLENTGTRAGGSIRSYGNNDVFYLSDTGIRSLRARDSSGAPSTTDVGTAIDPMIRELLVTLPQAEIEAAVSVLDVVDSRYWLALGDTIFVLSYFEGSKVNGWSTYTPGFRVTRFARIDDRIYARGDDDQVYAYGGETGQAYPLAGEAPVTARLPYLTAGKPATRKTLTALDVAAIGRWRARVLLDPRNAELGTHWIEFDGSTYTDFMAAMVGESTHLAPHLACDTDGYALLINLAVHFEESQDR